MSAKRPGRKPKCSAATIEAISKALQGGNTYANAANLAGIGESTFWRWLERAEEVAKKLEEGVEPDPAELIYLELQEAVVHARAFGEAFHVSRLVLAAQGRPGSKTVEELTKPDGTVVRTVTEVKELEPDWKASAFFLERRNPKDWGRRNQLSNEEGNGPPTVVLTANEINEAVQQGLAKAGGFRQSMATSPRVNPLEDGDEEPGEDA